MKTKMVIAVRKDLKMRRGKEAAQVSHGVMKVWFDRMEKTEEDAFGSLSTIYKGRFTPEMIEWKESDYPKVVVGVDSEDEIYKLAEEAKAANIPYAVIIDNGFTEFAGKKTTTCIAIGPDENHKMDKITGNLKLR